MKQRGLLLMILMFWPFGARGASKADWQKAEAVLRAALTEPVNKNETANI